MKKRKILNLVMLIILIITINEPFIIKGSELIQENNLFISSKEEENKNLEDVNSRDIVSGGNGNTGQAPYTYYDYEPGDGDFRGYFREGTKYNGSTAQFMTSNVAFSPKNTFMSSFTNGYIQYISGATTTPPASWEALTQVQKDKIGMAYSYGAMKVKEENDLDWLLGINMIIENGGNAVNTDSFPMELKTKVEELNSQVEYYNSPPSFMTDIDGNIELTWNPTNSRYETELTDDTGIFDEKWLDNFLEVDGIDGFHFEDPIGDNNILIYTDDSTATTTINMKNDYMPDSNFTFSDGVTTVAIPTSLTFYNTTYNHGMAGATMVTGIDYEAKLNPTITVKEARGSIELSNCGYIEDGTCIPLEGSVFTLEDEDGNIISTTTTDSNGQATFLDVPLGNYKVYQTLVLGNYAINTTVYNISLGEDNQIVKVNNGNSIENEIISGYVSLKKVGIKNNNDDKLYPLEGVEFTIYKDKNENNIIDEEDEEDEVLITDENGEIHSSKLAKGKYIISETATIEGYINNGYEEPFEISTSDNIKLNGGMDLINNIKFGQVEVKTVGVDDEETTLLENTHLLIYKDENKNGKIDKEDTEVETMTTNKEGYAISNNLIYGDYILVERTVNEEYILNDEEFLFSIKEDKKVEKVNDGNAIENRKILEDISKIEIHKIDEEGNSLKGVEFTLYKDENKNGKIDKGDIKVDNLLTNADGKIIFENLNNGQYILKETKGLKGYINNKDEFLVNIDDEDIYNLEIINKKETAILSEINTDNPLEIKEFLNTSKGYSHLFIPLLCFVIIKLKY